MEKILVHFHFYFWCPFISRNPQLWLINSFHFITLYILVHPFISHEDTELRTIAYQCGWRSWIIELITKRTWMHLSDEDWTSFLSRHWQSGEKSKRRLYPWYDGHEPKQRSRSRTTGNSLILLSGKCCAHPSFCEGSPLVSRKKEQIVSIYTDRDLANVKYGLSALWQWVPFAPLLLFRRGLRGKATSYETVRKGWDTLLPADNLLKLLSANPLSHGMTLEICAQDLIWQWQFVY